MSGHEFFTLLQLIAIFLTVLFGRVIVNKAATAYWLWRDRKEKRHERSHSLQ
jgi:hypothetical protein